MKLRLPVCMITFAATMMLNGCGEVRRASNTKAHMGMKAHIITEKAYLGITKNVGSIVEETGPSVGSLGGRVVLVYNKISAQSTFTTITSNGSFTGKVEISKYNPSVLGYFSFNGLASISDGAGVFAKANSENLKVSGYFPGYAPPLLLVPARAEGILIIKVVGTLYY